MRTWLVSICLTACCLFFSSLLSARDLRRFVPQLPEQTVDLQNVSSSVSTDSSSSEVTPVEDAVPPSDPEDSANGSPSSSGTAGPQGSSSSKGSGAALPAT